MQKRIVSFFISFFILIMSIGMIANAQPLTSEYSSFGPTLENLKNPKILSQSLNELKRIRTNLLSIKITADTPTEDLVRIDKELDFYLNEFHNIRRSLSDNALELKDSASDSLFSEQVAFIATSYILSTTQQQNLIRSLIENKNDSKNLFYANNLIPVYYYITLGDQMMAYLETYYKIM